MAISPCSTRTDAQGRELVEHGTALFPIAAYHDDLTEAEVPWHWHDELEAVAVTEGSMVFSVGRESRILRAGEGCVVNAGALHSARSGGAGPCRLHSLVFHPKLVGGSAESVFWQKYLHPLTESGAFRFLPLLPEQAGDGILLAHIERAWNACAEEPSGYEFAVRQELSRLIFLVWERFAAGWTPSSGSAKRSEERIKAMLTYIRDRLAEELSVQDIAAAASVSPGECIRCFRNTIGVTPIRYVKQLRLQRAAELLSGSGQKVNEVAAACGFREMSYFSRAFREQYGATPTEYRAARSERAVNAGKTEKGGAEACTRST